VSDNNLMNTLSAGTNSTLFRTI